MRYGKCWAMLFVDDSASVFVCDGKKWNSIKGRDGENANDGDNGKSCRIKENKDKSLTITCETEKGSVSYDVKNGKDAEKAPAKDAVCSSSKNKAGDTTTVTCKDASGKTISEVKIADGKKGKTGGEGNFGHGCSMVDGELGLVLVICGEGDDADTVKLYKTVCGKNSYDVEKEFCVDGSVYNLCDGKTYDLKKEFCFNDSLYDMCAGNSYNLSKYECLRNFLFGKLNDPREGDKQYETVVINGVEWMRKNLNYAYPKTSETDSSSFCYGNNTDNCKTYGRLYTWEAAQNACPEGSHLPNAEEWKSLISPLAKNIEGDIYKNAGMKLCDFAWGWNSGNGIDSLNYSALPAGWRDEFVDTEENPFKELKSSTYFWSSTEDDGSAFFVALRIDYPAGLFMTANKTAT